MEHEERLLRAWLGEKLPFKWWADWVLASWREGGVRALANETLPNIPAIYSQAQWERQWHKMQRVTAAAGSDVFWQQARVALAEVEAGEAAGWYCSWWDDPQRPPGWHDVVDVPARVWWAGSRDISWPQRYLTIVGSRSISAYGLSVLQTWVPALAAAVPVTIVSGVARGVDQAAMREAIQCNQPTIGVLGCGLNMLAPRLLAEFAGSRKILLSEFGLGFAGKDWTFPKRNRLLAAAGDGVLVVEAGHPSGTVSTVNHAGDLGRPVLLVAHNVFSKTAKGIWHLYENNGIKIVASVEDVMSEIWHQPKSGEGKIIFPKQWLQYSEPVQLLLQLMLQDQNTQLPEVWQERWQKSAIGKEWSWRDTWLQMMNFPGLSEVGGAWGLTAVVKS